MCVNVSSCQKHIWTERFIHHSPAAGPTVGQSVWSQQCTDLVFPLGSVWQHRVKHHLIQENLKFQSGSEWMNLLEYLYNDGHGVFTVKSEPVSIWPLISRLQTCVMILSSVWRRYHDLYGGPECPNKMCVNLHCRGGSAAGGGWEVQTDTRSVSWQMIGRLCFPTDDLTETSSKMSDREWVSTDLWSLRVLINCLCSHFRFLFHQLRIFFFKIPPKFPHFEFQDNALTVAALHAHGILFCALILKRQCSDEAVYVRVSHRADHQQEVCH